MAGIQDFIRLASSNLQLNEKTARSATGVLLDVIQQKLAVSDFQNLMSQLPGAADLVGQAASGAAGKAGGGLLGGVMKAAGSMLGGKVGTAVGLAAAMQGTGLDVEKIGGFVAQFVAFARKNVSADLVSRMLKSVPDLEKKLV
ncbi:MAG TPA: DUF2780 domain-containing protein [Thermoanaerobaculia bacterium]